MLVLRLWEGKRRLPLRFSCPPRSRRTRRSHRLLCFRDDLQPPETSRLRAIHQAVPSNPVCVHAVTSYMCDFTDCFKL